MKQSILAALTIGLALSAGPPARGEFYEVGPQKRYANLRDVPWHKLRPGDQVKVHWREEPYRDKVHLSKRGEPERPIVVEGVPDKDGSLPLLDDRDAVENPHEKYFTNHSRNQPSLNIV